MKIRNLLTAGVASLAMAVTAVPAAAQSVGGQITIGVGDPVYVNPYDRNRNGYDDRYENMYGYGYTPNYGYGYPAYSGYNTTSPLGALAGAILSIPFGQHTQFAGTCGRNKVELRLNNVSFRSGRVVLARDVGYNGMRMGERLRGKTFWPTSGRVCVNYRDIQSGRTTIVHDVNNNGRFDFRDGIGRISYGALGYGSRNVVNVRFAYGFRY